MPKWVKASIKWPEDWKLARKIGTNKSMPILFAPHVIADVSGETYKPDEIEWLDEEEISFTLDDMKQAYNSGAIYGFEKCGSGISNETFKVFIKNEYNIDYEEEKS